MSATVTGRGHTRGHFRTKQDRPPACFMACFTGSAPAVHETRWPRCVSLARWRIHAPLLGVAWGWERPPAPFSVPAVHLDLRARKTLQRPLVDLEEDLDTDDPVGEPSDLRPSLPPSSAWAETSTFPDDPRGHINATAARRDREDSENQRTTSVIRDVILRRMGNSQPIDKSSSYRRGTTDLPVRCWRIK